MAIANLALGLTLALLLLWLLWLIVRVDAACLACALRDRGPAVTFTPEAPAECSGY
jgi:hypothetical protein